MVTRMPGYSFKTYQRFQHCHPSVKTERSWTSVLAVASISRPYVLFVGTTSNSILFHYVVSRSAAVVDLQRTLISISNFEKRHAKLHLPWRCAVHRQPFCASRSSHLSQWQSNNLITARPSRSRYRFNRARELGGGLCSSKYDAVILKPA